MVCPTALFLKAAKANYLWQNSKGTGSLALPFETILDKAQKADFWIAPGDFSSLQEMRNQNPHYQQFAAFQNKKVYSYAKKRGATGGIVYFELAATRPDLVLKDLIKIIHPELVPNHSLFFFEPLK
jgi:iron complex transport system substrate-binding protein